MCPGLAGSGSGASASASASVARARKCAADGASASASVGQYDPNSVGRVCSVQQTVQLTLLQKKIGSCSASGCHCVPFILPGVSERKRENGKEKPKGGH